MLWQKSSIFHLFFRFMPIISFYVQVLLLSDYFASFSSILAISPYFSVFSIFFINYLSFLYRSIIHDRCDVSLNWFFFSCLKYFSFWILYYKTSIIHTNYNLHVNRALTSRRKCANLSKERYQSWSCCTDLLFGAQKSAVRGSA
jgi:hypothetical protein